MKQLVTALILIASALTTAEAGVTAIKGVRNYSSNTIHIRSTEMGHGYDIPRSSPGDWASPVDIWIPWATDPNQFQGHHIWIEVPWGTIRYVIWQAAQYDGDWVRYNTRRVFESPGTRVPGFAYVDGNRFLTVYGDRIDLSPISSLRGKKARRSKHAK